MDDIKKLADDKLSKKVRAKEAGISDLSHLNDGETGFNPTATEMAEVFEGIKAGIEARGKKEGSGGKAA